MSLGEAINQIEKDMGLRPIKFYEDTTFFGFYKGLLDGLRVISGEDPNKRLDVVERLKNRIGNAARYMKNHSVKKMLEEPNIDVQDYSDAMRVFYGESQLAFDILEDAASSGLVDPSKLEPYINSVKHVDSKSDEEGIKKAMNVAYRLLDKLSEKYSV